MALGATMKGFWGPQEVAIAYLIRWFLNMRHYCHFFPLKYIYQNIYLSLKGTSDSKKYVAGDRQVN